MRPAALFVSLWILSGCDGSLPASPPPVEQGRFHVARRGETLFSIAEGAYGNGLLYHKIWEANPWIEDADLLPAGRKVYIPPRDESWGNPPSRTAFALDPGTGAYEGDDEDGQGAAPGFVSQDPGSNIETPGIHVFRNLATNVASKTLFGVPVHRTLLLLFIAGTGHAFLVAILVWLAANITFVKEASFKKAMKAMAQTEMLTFATLIVLSGIGILMLYLGTEPPADAAVASPLFPALESYLRTPAGLGLAGMGLLGLYVILSLRFLPQAFAVPMGRAATVMAVAILIPHLAGAYLIGQRTGLIR